MSNWSIFLAGSLFQVRLKVNKQRLKGVAVPAERGFSNCGYGAMTAPKLLTFPDIGNGQPNHQKISAAKKRKRNIKIHFAFFVTFCGYDF